MLAIYFLTAGISAGLMGVFGRHVIAQLGFVSDFQTGVLLAAGLACAYLVTQFAYTALVRLLMPTRNPAPLFFDALSHGATLVFLPFLVGIDMPWPAEILQKIEPLIYIAAFAAVHAPLKLMAFFAATQSAPAHRLGGLFWLACCGASAMGAALCLNFWYQALTKARFMPLPTTEAMQVGDVWREALPLLEGAFYTFPLPDMTSKSLAFAWGISQNSTDNLEEIHITFELKGKNSTTLLHSLELEPGEWTELRIPTTQIPNDTRSCTLFWHAQEEAEWIRQTNIRPVQLTDRSILLSGPLYQRERDHNSSPNVIILALEGLSAEHIGALGYGRKNTPNLDQFAGNSMLYNYAYAPAPEAIASCMTLLTGLDPLRHNYFGEQIGRLPAGVETLPEVLREIGYATAAFTEGAAVEGQDLVFGSGFERGFDFFNATLPLGPTKTTENLVTPRSLAYAGANVTFDRAADWIAKHRDTKFMTFIRVRELRNPLHLPRYGKGFVGTSKNPRGVDIYDTAINWLDHQIGLFLTKLQELEAYDNTCIIITAPYGLDFDASGNNPRPLLGESSLRVPLFVRIPGEEGRQRSGIVQLQDVAPTILNITGAAFEHPITGDGLLDYSLQRSPAISIAGDPLSLSLRTTKWRFTWNSGLRPFTLEQVGEPSIAYMWDMDRYRTGREQRDNIRENVIEVEDFTEMLIKYIEGSDQSLGEVTP